MAQPRITYKDGTQPKFYGPDHPAIERKRAMELARAYVEARKRIIRKAAEGDGA